MRMINIIVKVLCSMFSNCSKKIVVLQQQQKWMCCSFLGNYIHIHAICHMYSSNPAGAGICKSHAHTHTHTYTRTHTLTHTHEHVKHSLLTIHWRGHNLRIAQFLVSRWLRGHKNAFKAPYHIKFHQSLDHYSTMTRSSKEKSPKSSRTILCAFHLREHKPYSSTHFCLQMFNWLRGLCAALQ